jgi:hypothetical protein
MAVYATVTAWETVFYMPIYAKVIDLEKYRVSDRPWPWEGPDWPRLRRKTFFLVAFNDLLLAPATLYLGKGSVLPRTDLASFPCPL